MKWWTKIQIKIFDNSWSLLTQLKNRGNNHKVDAKVH